MTDSIKALIFGPGLHAAGVAGSISVRATGLEASVQEQVQRASLTQLQLREVGFGKPGLELAWIDGGEQWAAHVLDPDAAAQLLRSPFIASLPQAQAFRSKQRKSGTGRAVGWSLLGLLVLSPLLLLALFFMQADRIAGWVADQIPIEEEYKLGKVPFESMKGSLKLQDSGPALAAVRSIGKQLTQASKYNYEFHVVQDDTLNAFALPGGIVVVHTGLIAKTKRPEELAGVLAHEVQHVEQRHSLEGMVKNLGLRAVWALVTGDLGGTLAGEAALQLTTLKFSRDAETEADDKGFDALVKHGIDPSGMPDFFMVMSEQAVDAPAAFLSTHPLSEGRQQELAQRVEGLQQKSFKPLAIQSWPPQVVWTSAEIERATKQLLILADKLEKGMPLTPYSVRDLFNKEFGRMPEDIKDEHGTYIRMSWVWSGDLPIMEVWFREQGTREDKINTVSIGGAAYPSDADRCISGSEVGLHFGKQEDHILDNRSEHLDGGIARFYKRRWGYIQVSVDRENGCLTEIIFVSPNLLKALA